MERALAAAAAVVAVAAMADLLDELLCADQVSAGVGRLISQGPARKDGHARRLAPAVRQEGHATHSLVRPLRLHVELDDAIHRRLHACKVQRPDEGQRLADMHPHLRARQAHRHARESSS